MERLVWNQVCVSKYYVHSALIDLFSSWATSCDKLVLCEMNQFDTLQCNSTCLWNSNLQQTTTKGKRKKNVEQHLLGSVQRNVISDPEWWNPTVSVMIVVLVFPANLQYLGEKKKKHTSFITRWCFFNKQLEIFENNTWNKAKNFFFFFSLCIFFGSMTNLVHWWL